MPVSTSSLVRTKSVTPLTRVAYARSRRRTNPSGAAGRGGAELGTGVAQLLALRIEQLGGERSLTDPRRYALTTAITRLILVCWILLPVHAPPAVASRT